MRREYLTPLNFVMYLPLIVIVYNIKYSSINCDVTTGGVAPVQAKIKKNDIFQYMIMQYIIFQIDLSGCLFRFRWKLLVQHKMIHPSK